MIKRQWLSSIATDNPLVRLHPLSTVSASEEHLSGLAQIQERLAGQPKSREMDIVIANNIKMSSNAMGYLSGQLETVPEDVKQQTGSGVNEDNLEYSKG